jgi:hypothetical protein
MILRLVAGAAAGIASTRTAAAHPIYKHLIDAAILTVGMEYKTRRLLMEGKGREVAW